MKKNNRTRKVDAAMTNTTAAFELILRTCLSSPSLVVKLMFGFFLQAMVGVVIAHEGRVYGNCVCGLQLLMLSSLFTCFFCSRGCFGLSEVSFLLDIN